MKKMLALLLLVCLLPIGACASPIEEVTVGMSRAYVKSLIEKQGETVSYEDESTLYVSGETMYLNLNFSPDPDTVSWINLSIAGYTESPYDLTVPDWTLTMEDVMRTLRSNSIAYDLFLGDGDPTVYCDVNFCGDRMTMSMTFHAQTRLLTSVNADLYRNESPLALSARMTGYLGEPTPLSQSFITDNANGPSHDICDRLYWLSKGSLYTLEHRLMTYSYINDENEADLAWESRISIHIHQP